MKKNTLIASFCLILILFIGYYEYQHTKQGGSVIKINKCDSNSAGQKAKNIDANIAKYSTTTKDILNQSSEGGKQTNYIYENKSVLIKQVFYGEIGKSEVNYYLENGKVFYVKKINTEYMLPLSEDSSGKVKNVETKEFYLDSNQDLCSWYLNQKLQSNDPDTKDLVHYLISGL